MSNATGKDTQEEGHREESGEEKRRFIIDTDERHEIVKQFVSDVMRGFRQVSIESLSPDYQEILERRFQIVSGAHPSTAEERADAEVQLYNDIARLTLFGTVSGNSTDGQVSSKEVVLLRERIDKTNGAVMAIAKRLGDMLDDINERLKERGI